MREIITILLSYSRFSGKLDTCKLVLKKYKGSHLLHYDCTLHPGPFLFILLRAATVPFVTGCNIYLAVKYDVYSYVTVLGKFYSKTYCIIMVIVEMEF